MSRNESMYDTLRFKIGEYSLPVEPKSMSFTLRKSSETTMFSGLISPWTNNLSCMYANPLAAPKHSLDEKQAEECMCASVGWRRLVGA